MFPEEITLLFKELDALLARNRPSYYAALQPGATAAMLDEFEQRFSLQLPPAFRALYQWRNGQHPACSANLHRNRMFTPLGDVADTKDMLDGMIGADFEDERWWRRAWVPFLSNGGGDHLCLDLCAEDGGQPGQLIAFRHDEPLRKIEWPSVQAWIKELIASGIPRIP